MNGQMPQLFVAGFAINRGTPDNPNEQHATRDFGTAGHPERHPARPGHERAAAPVVAERFASGLLGWHAIGSRSGTGREQKIVRLETHKWQGKNVPARWYL